MSYSYIKPREKSAFTPKVQLLFVIFDSIVLFLLGIYLFLVYKDYTFLQQKQQLETKIIKVKYDVKSMRQEMHEIEKKRLFCEKTETQNTLFKDCLKNLFDLVPRKIVLSEIKVMDERLVLKGKTPNRYIYDTMLKTPLHSIYANNKSSLKLLDNGWYEFNSVNYLDEKKEEQK